MSDGNDLIDRVEAVVEPLLSDMDIEIVDIEWRGEADGRVLAFLLDTEGGIGVEECGKASEVIGHALDRSGAVEDRYNLEVSSPGLDRPLKTADHFRRVEGSKVMIKTAKKVHERKSFKGDIVSADDTGVIVKVDNEEYRVDYQEIRKANLVFEYGPSPKPGKKQLAGRKNK